MTSPSAIADGTTRSTGADPFALWSEVYDEQPNPLLSLEENFLSCLLPDVRELDVVDMGCGTGRWLQRLAPQHPRSLLGIDNSSEMLARAKGKVGGHAVLLRADCASALVSAGSADLCLASFVVSHVRDLGKFARQLARILRAGGHAFITDVHPETAASLGWKRSFRYGDQSISLHTHERPIREVMAALRKHGFQVAALLEPCFQAQQQKLLKLHSSRIDVAALRSPAIYILQVQAPGAQPRRNESTDSSSLRVIGARISFGPRASAVAELNLSGGSVGSIASRFLGHSVIPDAQSLDLSGYLLLPGLINSHDHLEFGLFPNLGRGSYRNAAEWADDIQQREAGVIAQRRRIPKPVRCWWGAIRNLLCGATTVCHHNPLLAEFSDPNFPVRVLRDYRWAHSLSFDPEIVAGKCCDCDATSPFIIHAGEGVDASSTEEIAALDRRELLNDRTVLVHALALNPYTVSLLNRRGASVVWCPASNRFLFGRTLDGDLLSRIHNLVLGSDSALTSPGDLLDDIRFAYRETGISSEQLYEMVYTAPARVFRMRDGEGSLKIGGVADLIAINDTGAEPAEALANLSGRHIELVILRGRVQLVRNSILERLPEEMRECLEPVQVDGETVWLRAPIAELFKVAAGALQDPIQVGGRRVHYVASH
jgi:cytosine/adenosine deaminase-related metal-dependent hydrolase/SAM-dependent methyltransferase